jgi:hypothetical protein
MNLISAFALAGALVLGSHAASATADGCAVVLKTPDEFLNLRKAPMMGANVVAKLRPGDQLYISSATCETKGSLSICNEEGWTKVDAVWRLDGNNFSKPWRLHRGWVSSRFLRFVECEH